MMYYRVVDRPNTRCLTWRTQDRRWRARRTGDGARACSISHFATVIITCFVIFCCFCSVLFYVVAACCMPVVIVIAGPLPLPICINICRVTPTPTFPPPSTNYAQLAPYTFFLLCCVCVLYCLLLFTSGHFIVRQQCDPWRVCPFGCSVQMYDFVCVSGETGYSSDAFVLEHENMLCVALCVCVHCCHYK